MKGLEISYNGKITKIPINDTKLTTIDISDVNGVGKIYIGNIDYDKRKRNVWYNDSLIKLHDKFEIKMVDIDDISEPIESIIDESIKQPISKLEHFLQIETYLREKGLL